MIENIYPDRRWLVIPTSITSSINFSEVEETSINTLRLSVDQTETFVKYPVTVVTASYTQSWYDPITHQSESVLIPSGTYGRPSIYTSSYSEYEYPEILELLSTPFWTDTGSMPTLEI
jgi:hypothetical protein